MTLSRRAMLGGLGGLVVGGAVAGLTGGVAHAAGEVKPATPAETKRFAQIGGDFSWKPHKLDLGEVAKVAHEGYHYKGYG